MAFDDKLKALIEKEVNRMTTKGEINSLKYFEMLTSLLFNFSAAAICVDITKEDALQRLSEAWDSVETLLNG